MVGTARATILGEVLRAGDGVATRHQLLSAVPRTYLDFAVRRGELVRLLPCVYTWAGRESAPEIRVRGAIAFAGPGAALSHTSAARRWDFPLSQVVDDRVHILTARSVHHRSAEFVVVHRPRGDVLAEGLVVARRGIPVVTAVHALIQTWSILGRDHRRAVVIDTVRDGHVRPRDVLAATAEWSQLCGRRELRELSHDLQAGAHSELEIYGLHRIFRAPGLPPARHQWELLVNGRRRVLDVAWPDLKLAVELDGAAYHGSQAARERDVASDAALAALGWQVIRVTYRRLREDPDGVLRELMRIIATRRAQLSA